MCGLCGVFAYDREGSPNQGPELRRMCDAMRSRGPDGNGSWDSDDGRVTLGHLRLAIIDLTEDGAQPFTTADGRYTIVFNGEIYNYRELRAELAEAGAVFRSHSDTEVIVELYRRHGARCFAMLRGMYAVALWDGAANELVLARDPFGIKPLYIADNGKVLRFASQVKALVAGGGVRRAGSGISHPRNMLGSSNTGRGCSAPTCCGAPCSCPGNCPGSWTQIWCGPGSTASSSWSGGRSRSGASRARTPPSPRSS
jgi:asparagine synthase (glutamine-hydrolysing)